ncbi:MAG TPA: SPOR domain-containing protein [Roseiarcus sp.]|nr:SPOR domain-containing protein [Roseiarcus sp.]
MSISGSRATDEINLDEFERRLRAAGAQQSQAEDPLAELSRLVEFSHMGIANGETPARRPAEAPVARAAPSTSIETGTLRPTLDDEVEELAPGASEDDRAARRDYEFDARHSDSSSAADPGEERRPMRWKLAVSALAIAGVAMIGAVFALRGGVPGLKKDIPFIAAAQGPTKVAPPSDQTVTTSSDAGATLLHDNGKPAPVKVVNSEEQPVDLNAQAAANNPPASAAQGGTTDPALNAIINTPLVAPQAAAPPKGMTSEFPDPKPVRTISLRPDGTPIGAMSPLDQQPASSANAAPAPVEPASKPAVAPSASAPSTPAPKTINEAAGVAQPSTPKIELPTKLSPPKSAARVAVGKTDTTAPDGTAQIPPGEAQNSAPAKPDKAAKKPKAGQVVDATETTGAIAPPVDATAATTSGGWSVQLAAPKSEAEAKSTATKLTSKYGAELNGSAIGVHKAEVNGETIYRLRVSGLTKADAAAMCARLKGEGGQCFIAK